MAPLSAAGQGALNTLNTILNTILKSRIQRKAKSVIVSAAECLIVLFAILQTFLQLEIENAQVELGLRLSIYVGAGYTAFIALFLFFHSIFFIKVVNMETSESVEKAYAKTNAVPIVDGILEIPFPILFRGPFWYIAYLAWIVCGGVIGSSSYFFYVVREDLTMEARATLVAGALLLYQITSDFSEYWVHSRNRQSATSAASSASSAANSENYDDTDMEASNLVGKRETASAGFTRI